MKQEIKRDTFYIVFFYFLFLFSEGISEGSLNPGSYCHDHEKLMRRESVKP